MIRVNVGCGQSPTDGWTNLDNSPSLRLSRFPTLVGVAARLRLLAAPQLQFIEFARRSSIEWADATKDLPFATASVEALYTSHMLEHLDRAEVTRFLVSARRVLCAGGVLRVAVPDLRILVDEYLATGSADRFIGATLLAAPKPRTLIERAYAAVVGGRHHHWMYDGRSLAELLTAAGFIEAAVAPAGTTRIANPGALDLREREEETLYVEAINPG